MGGRWRPGLGPKLQALDALVVRIPLPLPPEAATGFTVMRFGVAVALDAPRCRSRRFPRRLAILGEASSSWPWRTNSRPVPTIDDAKARSLSGRGGARAAQKTQRRTCWRSTSDMADKIAQGKTAGVFKGKSRGKAVVTGGPGSAARVVGLLGGMYLPMQELAQTSGNLTETSSNLYELVRAATWWLTQMNKFAPAWPRPWPWRTHAAGGSPRRRPPTRLTSSLHWPWRLGLRGGAKESARQAQGLHPG